MPDIKESPIGVFDSGVGGLSVLMDLERLMPNENFVFLADQLYVPYGEKSKDELVKLTARITNFFKRKHNIKMMVVACNTATCGAIDELRMRFPSLPIVGTVPAVKTAGEKSQTGTVAVISTPSTSQSKALRQLIKTHCQDLNVLNIGCANLEDTVEHGDVYSGAVSKLLIKYLAQVRNSKADHLVLGCTHYVFLKKTLNKFLGPRVKLVDGNLAIASHTKSLLSNHFLENTENKRGKTIYFTTGNSAKFSKVASKLLKHKVTARKVKI
jgi:glutamate racemase